VSLIQANTIAAIQPSALHPPNRLSAKIASVSMLAVPCERNRFLQLRRCEQSSTKAAGGGQRDRQRQCDVWGVPREYTQNASRLCDRPPEPFDTVPNH
jgi:hypothetical protein